MGDSSGRQGAWAGEGRSSVLGPARAPFSRGGGQFVRTSHAKVGFWGGEGGGWFPGGCLIRVPPLLPSATRGFQGPSGLQHSHRNITRRDPLRKLRGRRITNKLRKPTKGAPSKEPFPFPFSPPCSSQSVVAFRISARVFAFVITKLKAWILGATGC